jgi:hypothetical protein
MIWENSFRYLTTGSVIMCTHGGVLQFADKRGRAESDSTAVLTTQSILMATIVGCSQVTPATKPCLKIIQITKGISKIFEVDGVSAITDEFDFVTDGDPPGSRQCSSVSV